MVGLQLPRLCAMVYIGVYRLAVRMRPVGVALIRRHGISRPPWRDVFGIVLSSTVARTRQQADPRATRRVKPDVGIHYSHFTIQYANDRLTV